jgi:hypothetical protein
MKGWKFHDDYVRCADCKTLRPLEELEYRKFAAVDSEGRAGEHHCDDRDVCKKMRADELVKSATVQTSAQRTCRQEGCRSRPNSKRDVYCSKHIGRGRMCKVDGCKRPLYRLGLCFGHCKRKQRGQDVNVELQPRPARRARR